jgi:PAS domain S-box-containing protein
MNADLLAAVLERTDVAIVACDAVGTLVVSNAAARELFGPETPPVDHPLMCVLVESALRGVEVVRDALTVAGVTVLISAQPLFDAHGDRLGAVATCAPLSGVVERQRRETEESRKRLELLLESTGEGIYGIDTNGKCIFVNGSAAAMLGHRREDLIGQQMHEAIHHTDANGQPYPVEECPIYRAFREGRGCRIDDELFFRADGSSFPAEYSSYPIIDQGVVLGSVITFNDITSRKRAEDALRKSEAKYRSLFETVSEGIYQTSPNGELLAANRALVEMLGYSSENELRAHDVHELYVDPEDRKRLTAILERDGILFDAELQLKRKDGRVIRVIENSRAIRDERKRLIYYEGTLSLSH